MNRLTVRKTLFYIMVFLGIIMLFTGVVLYLWPHGPQSGRMLFLGATKGTWSDWHTYLSLAAAGIIIVHLIENVACVRRYVGDTIGAT
jgi:cytochrome b subunit of formate dehydrogenase